MARKLVTFTGRNGAGVISVSGLRSGDKIISVVLDSSSTGQDDTGSFASFVLIDDELVQISAGDRSSYTLAALIERHVMLP